MITMRVRWALMSIGMRVFSYAIATGNQASAVGTSVGKTDFLKGGFPSSDIEHVLDNYQVNQPEGYKLPKQPRGLLRGDNALHKAGGTWLNYNSFPEGLPREPRVSGETDPSMQNFEVIGRNLGPGNGDSLWADMMPPAMHPPPQSGGPLETPQGSGGTYGGVMNPPMNNFLPPPPPASSWGNGPVDIPPEIPGPPDSSDPFADLAPSPGSNGNPGATPMFVPPSQMPMFQQPENGIAVPAGPNPGQMSQQPDQYQQPDLGSPDNNNVPVQQPRWGGGSNRPYPWVNFRRPFYPAPWPMTMNYGPVPPVGMNGQPSPMPPGRIDYAGGSQSPGTQMGQLTWVKSPFKVGTPYIDTHRRVWVPVEPGTNLASTAGMRGKSAGPSHFSNGTRVWLLAPFLVGLPHYDNVEHATYVPYMTTMRTADGKYPAHPPVPDIINVENGPSAGAPLASPVTSPSQGGPPEPPYSPGGWQFPAQENTLSRFGSNQPKVPKRPKKPNGGKGRRRLEKSKSISEPHHYENYMSGGYYKTQPTYPWAVSFPTPLRRWQSLPPQYNGYAGNPYESQNDGEFENYATDWSTDEEGE